LDAPLILVIIRILTFLIVLIFISIPVAAEEWHGLRPGTSTRQDVIGEFGECPESQRECEFNLADEDVFIEFAGADTCANSIERRVLLIQRDFAVDASFASLNLNQLRFKKFDPSWPRGIGYQGFINEDIGLAVKTFNKQIIQVAYFPGSRERQFCPGYYAKPREFVDAQVEHAPNLFIKCRKGPASAGEQLTFKAEYLRGLFISLTWSATAGTIVEGQGRRRMILDTTGLNGKTIKVTVERIDSTGRIAMDSCEIKFQK
jgi:hypothetical protein